MSREIFLNRNRQLVGRKNSPERLLAILKFAAEMPVVADICRRAAISRTSLEYWLAKSEKGRPGDGFDVDLGDTEDDGETPRKTRFHEAYYAAFKDGMDMIEREAHLVARGEKQEILTYKGRVVYKIDPLATALGLQPEDRGYFLEDENGKPIPESIPMQDMDMIRFMLKSHRRDVYGDHSKVDVTLRGGVLVLGAKQTAEEFEKQFGGKQDIQDVEFEEVEADDDPAA
jgi:hypothetical protein